MRFTIFNTVAFTLTLCGYSVAASLNYNDFLQYVPYTNCLKLVQFIENYNTTALTDIWQNKVCDTGCRPNVAHYHPKARALAVPIIEAEAMKMDMSNLVPFYITMMDRGYQWAFDQCGAGKLPKGELCSNQPELEAMAECGRDNFWRFFMSNLGEVLPTISDNNCKKTLEYASDPKYISETVPMYLDQYVKEMC